MNQINPRVSLGFSYIKRTHFIAKILLYRVDAYLDVAAVC